MKERPYAAMTVVLLMLSAAYIGGYVLLVTPQRFVPAARPLANGSHLLVGIADYRCAPQVCDKLFRPLEQLDRWLRPERWEGILVDPQSALRLKSFSDMQPSPKTEVEPTAGDEP